MDENSSRCLPKWLRSIRVEQNLAPADGALQEGGLHVEEPEHALELLDVHLPTVVLVHDAEDLVDQPALLLQHAAGGGVEEPRVLASAKGYWLDLCAIKPRSK